MIVAEMIGLLAGVITVSIAWRRRANRKESQILHVVPTSSGQHTQ